MLIIQEDYFVVDRMIKYLLILILLLPTALAGWGEGGWGECGTVIQQSSSSGGSGATYLVGGSFSPYPTGTEAVNGTCEEDEQLYEDVCYKCNPTKGYLEFNPEDRSIICVSCNEDYILSENKTCILPSEKETKQYENLILYSLILIVVGILIAAPIYERFKKKRKKIMEEESQIG